MELHFDSKAMGDFFTEEEIREVWELWNRLDERIRAHKDKKKDGIKAPLVDDDLLNLAPKSARDSEYKDRMSLLPMDILRKYVVAAYEEGVAKYGRETWRNGFLVSELVDANYRHLNDFFWKVEDFDPETLEKFNIKKHHLAAVIFGCCSILHTIDTRPRLDDRCQHRGDLQKGKK